MDQDDEVTLDHDGITKFIINQVSKVYLDEDTAQITMMSKNCFLFELGDLKLTIDIRDNKKFN